MGLRVGNALVQTGIFANIARDGYKSIAYYMKYHITIYIKSENRISSLHSSPVCETLHETTVDNSFESKKIIYLGEHTVVGIKRYDS